MLTWLAAAFLAAASLISGPELLDRVVATVDGRAITLLELRRAELTGRMERKADETPEEFDSRVLSAMIDDYLRYRDALRFAPAPPDAAAVDRAMSELRQRLRAEGKDPEVEFRRAGLSDAEVRASVEKQLLVTKYVEDRFAAVVFVSSDDIRAEYEGPYGDRFRAAGLPVPPLDQARDQIRVEVRDRRTAKQIMDWTRELREKARISFVSTPAPDARATLGPPQPLSGSPGERPPNLRNDR